MAIRPYERKEQVDARVNGVDYSAPAVGNVGNALRQTGRSLLGTVEPILQRKRTMEGQIDAASAPLMKDAEGYVTRAEPIPGGGTVYADAFRLAASTLYKGRLMSDYEQQINNIVAAHPNDPMTAMANIKAHTEAVVETVPLDIRADIEPDLLRESSQRFNWLTNDKMSRDRANMTQGLEQDYAAKERLYLKQRSLAAGRGDDAIVMQLDNDFNNFASENRLARVNLNTLGAEGTEAEKTATQVYLTQMDEEMTAFKSKQTIVGRSKELVLDPKQLQLMVKWSTGDPTLGEGKVLDMNYTQYLQFLRTPEAVNEMSRYASEVISDMNNQAAAEAAVEAATANNLKDADIANRISVLGEMAFGDKGFRAEWNKSIDRNIAAKGMTITTYMNTYEGMVDMQNQVAQSGQLPVVLKSWIEGQTTGTNIHKVAEFVDNMVGVRSPKTGMGTGIAAWKQIDGKTRGYISRYRQLSDAGVPIDLRRDIVEQMISGKHETGSLAKAFDANDTKNGQALYLAARDKVILSMFGVPHSALPIPMRNQIDLDAKDFLHAYAQDPANAVKSAVEGVATMWTPSKLGVAGYIPTELSGLRLTDSQLDRAFGNYVDGKGHVYGGAGFTTKTHDGLPRARIELDDDSQLLKGVGNYKVYHYDIEGKLIYPIRRVNIDDVLSAHFGNQAALEQKMKEARIAGAKQRRSLQPGLEQQGAIAAGSVMP